MAWNPLEDILHIQGRLNSIFQDTYRSNASSKTGNWQPPVDIYETDTELIILLEVPGVHEDNIDMHIAEGVLSVSGEKLSPVDVSSDTYFRLERPYGRFSRSFTMPPGVDLSQVKATIRDGILKVTIAKTGKASPQNIKVVKV